MNGSLRKPLSRGKKKLFVSLNLFIKVFGYAIFMSDDNSQNTNFVRLFEMSPYSLLVSSTAYDIAGSGFATAHDKTPRIQVQPVQVTIHYSPQDKPPISGTGECMPYIHNGETVGQVHEEIGAMREVIEAGVSREELINTMPAGPSRNAIDAAFWVLECKQDEQTIWQKTGITKKDTLKTVYTLSVAEPENMVKQLKTFGTSPG